jgi:hypothetical protein
MADFWRYEQAQRCVAQLGTGVMHRRPPVPGMEDVVDEPSEMKSKKYVFKDVVFQQVDMHPVRGAWNAEQKAFLATADATEPLKVRATASATHASARTGVRARRVHASERGRSRPESRSRHRSQFLDFIEDAALVVPKGCREHLPRCLFVHKRDDVASVIFNRPNAGGAPRWRDE